ncbi:MAG: lycopene cyclase domain-containing protein [Candidatus Nanopelagicales bacterium]
MSRVAYLAILVGILAGTLWLEFALRTRVLRRLRRLALAVLPVVAAFSLWDIYAIGQGQWTFAGDRTTGLLLPGELPIEEALFFVVIPVASILTFEAVRSVNGWTAGDEESTDPAGASDKAAP